MKRVALIGCGGIGNYHLGHLLQFDDVKVAGACDLIAERAEGVAAKTGGQAFTDFRRMYDTVKPDMVFVCVPPTQHGEIELESVKRGIPMFIEKPIALDLATTVTTNSPRVSNVWPTRSPLSSIPLPTSHCTSCSGSSVSTQKIVWNGAGLTSISGCECIVMGKGNGSGA